MNNTIDATYNNTTAVYKSLASSNLLDNTYQSTFNNKHRKSVCWRSRLLKKGNTPDKKLIALVELVIYWSQPQKIINANIKEDKFTYKFSRDIWHTSYSDLSDKLGLSKDSIRRRLVKLEELGILKREFKTVIIDGCEYHSVMFLRLSSNFLRSVTGSSKISHLKTECSIEQCTEPTHPPKAKSPP